MIGVRRQHQLSAVRELTHRPAGGSSNWVSPFNLPTGKDPACAKVVHACSCLMARENSD